MIVINTVDAQKFTYNSIPYFKNFTPVVIGNKLEVVNTYSNQGLKLTDAPTIFSDFIVDGVTYASPALLQQALLPVLFTRDTLGAASNLNGLTDVDITTPTDGQAILYNSVSGNWENADVSGGGGGSNLITTGYTKATDFGNANFYPKAMFTALPIQDDANTDIWLASTFTNQRVIHHFGEGLQLDKITYVNGTRTVDGSNEEFGAKTVTIYAITADVDPVFTYGVTDANYTQIYTGDFAQYTISQAKNPPELTLTSVPATVYALVYDIMNNHVASGRIEIRRLSAYKS